MAQFNIAEVIETNAAEISVALILLGIVFIVNGYCLIAPVLGLALGAMGGVTLHALMLQFQDDLPVTEDQMLGISLVVGLVIFLIVRRLVTRIHMLVGGVLGAAITSIVLPIAAPLAGIELTFMLKAIIVDFGFLVGTKMLRGEGDTFAILISAGMGAFFVVQGGLVVFGSATNPLDMAMPTSKAIAVFVLLAAGTAGQMHMKWRKEDYGDDDAYEEWEDEYGDEPQPPPMIHQQVARGPSPHAMGGHGGRAPPMQMQGAPGGHSGQPRGAPQVRQRHADPGIEVRRRSGMRQFSFED